MRIIIAVVMAFVTVLFGNRVHNIKVENQSFCKTGSECFFSGDEFLRYYHNENGYPLVLENNQLYYAKISDKELTASSELFTSQNKNRSLTAEDQENMKKLYLKKRSSWQDEFMPLGYQEKNSPTVGNMNNLTIFISFADQNEFTTPRSVYEEIFNATDAPSLKNYYQEVSYNKLNITTYMYPEADLESNISFQDEHPRNYYMEYNSGSNTLGYRNLAEARIREHTLLKNAIEYVSSQISPEQDFDLNDDGLIDNFCFIFKGSGTQWGDVGIWPHSGVLNSFEVKLNGQRAYKYTIQTEIGAGNWSVFAHEMFHTLGAEDLYSYVNNSVPVGSWDLMAAGDVHMGAFMKYKNSGRQWITEIPVLEESGNYTLNSLINANNNCYRINSPYTDKEYFILEFRNKTGLYEKNIPGSGLLIYRINKDGASTSYGPPYEIFILRPLNVLSTTKYAYLDGITRTTANDYDASILATLSDGSKSGLDISNIVINGSELTFDLVKVNTNFVILEENHLADITKPYQLIYNVNGCEEAKTELFIDKELFQENNPGINEFTIPANTLSRGLHNLKIITTDVNGIIGYDEIDIYFSNGEAEVKLETDSLITMGETVELTPIINLLDWGIEINSAEYFVDDELISIETTTPYTFSLNTTDYLYGQHKLKIKVTLANGLISELEKNIYLTSSLLDEGFEGKFPPEGWSINSPVYGWYQSESKPFEGRASTAVRHYHPQGEAILYSPQITISKDCFLKFYWLDQDIDVTKVAGKDTTYCEISEDDLNWTIIGFLSDEEFIPQYQEFSHDLKKYEGKTIRLRFRDVTDESLYSQGVSLDAVRIVRGAPQVDISEKIIPEKLIVSAYPNPFNPVINLKLLLTDADDISFKIYNINGELVSIIADNKKLKKGLHSFKFNGGNLASGNYFYQLKSRKLIKNGKITLIK